MRRLSLLFVLAVGMTLCVPQAGADSRLLQARMFLGKHKATGYMRQALSRSERLGFRYTRDRWVRCNKRISRDRVRCKMGWNMGLDTHSRGRGTIWITYEGSRRYWNYSYRIKEVNEYCQSVGASNCTKVFVVR